MLIGIFLGENDRKISDAKDNIPFTKRFLFILLAIGLSLLTLAVEAWKLDGKLFFYA
jgi:hypothetical protein